MPVRRSSIPKPGGDEWPLGIPTIRDRVVQAAAKLVIEPIFEADFDDSAVKLYVTPASASWMNLVERFFAEIACEAHPARQLLQHRWPRGRYRCLSGTAQ